VATDAARRHVGLTFLPALRFGGEHEPVYKALRHRCRRNKSKYAPGKKVVLQFANRPALDDARRLLGGNGIRRRDRR